MQKIIPKDVPKQSKGGPEHIREEEVSKNRFLAARSAPQNRKKIVLSKVKCAYVSRNNNIFDFGRFSQPNFATAKTVEIFI